MFKIGVFAVIFNKQRKVLLCHRCDQDLWNLPGGSLENNETIYQGLKREVKEETGLTVVIEKLVGVYCSPQKQKKEIIFLFTVKAVSGEISLSEEADKINYFSFEEIPINTPPNQREKIKDAFQSSENWPFLR